jgi:uncharacterized small protein (DUF1192 family)
MKMRRFFAIALCLLLIFALLAGCSAKSNPAGNDYYAPQQNMGAEFNGSGSNVSGSNSVLNDRKLVRKISMDAETEDMDVLLADINTRIEKLGGYIESRNIQNGSAYASYRNRSATLVIRIPAENLDAFIQQVGENSNVVSTTEASDDVTLAYVDTESRLKVLRTEEQRLLQFLSEAKSVTEMLEIEKRLTTIQSEIESLTAQLKKYDNLVDYGTVTLNVTEVEVYTVVEEKEPTMWEDICEGFENSVKGLLAVGRGILVFFLGNSPWLILLALIGVGVWMIIRKRNRRYTHKPTPPTPKDSE